MLPKLVVVDGHALLFRSFYAIRNLTAPDGTPTNAIFGFIKSLHKVIQQLDPQYLTVCLDAQGDTFRHEQFADYKAQRKPTPQELIDQFEPTIEILNAMNIPAIVKEGYEADDLIASVVSVCEDNDIEVVIVSRDKDLFQLLSDRVSMYDDTKATFYTPKELMEEKGITPEQIPDWLGLMGDSSDNIPGVPGIGDKTALALIKEYGSLDAVVKAAPEIAAKRKKIGESLAQNAHLAYKSREIATIEPDTGITVDLAELQLGEPDYTALAEIYERLGFSSFLKEIAISIPSFPSNTDWKLITTEDGLEEVVREAASAGLFAVDTETTSLSCHSGKLIGISLAWTEQAGVYIPIREGYSQAQLAALSDLPLSLESVLRILGPLLADESVAKVGHNIRFDMNFLAQAGFQLSGKLYDTLIACWLLQPEGKSLKLDDLARSYLSIAMIPISDLIGRGKTSLTMADAPLRPVAEYAAEDADATLRLWNIVRPKLSEQGLDVPFNVVEMPLVPIIADMELTGILLDTARLHAINDGVAREIDALIVKIHEIAGVEFNINSTAQLATVLYDSLGLPVQKKGKVSRSTDARVLEKIRGMHPIVNYVLRYRMQSKLKSTYLDSLPQFVNPVTGAVHSSFNQTGTATGRLSSNKPNLQNIPARSDESREVRAAFIPRKSCLFVSADYSQIELRIMAHFSHDEGLIAAFREDRDIHTAVAQELYAVNADQVDSAMRVTAKAVNFGLIYGQGVFGLANYLGISRTESREFIEKYFAKYPNVLKFKETRIEEAREAGFIETLSGRRRYLPQLRSRSATERAQGERLCINTLIQGSAADLIKTAMINIHNRIRREQLSYRLLLQIHDELLYEVPVGTEIAARTLIEHEMVTALPLDVPLKVTAGIGSDWLELK